MTIVTKPLTNAKEKKEKEALETLVNIDNAGENGGANSVDDLKLDHLNTRAERVKKMTQFNIICLSLCLGFITMLGFMAGSHIYKTLFMQRYYCGSYKVPLPMRKIHDATFVSGKVLNNENIYDYYTEDDEDQNLFAVLNQDKVVDKTVDMLKDFEFDVELDLGDDMMEQVELPEVFSGRYLHDFMANKTVIIDNMAARCFIMNLDRNTIPKPRNLFEYLTNEKLGLYDMKYDEVKKSYRIVGDPLEAFDTRYHGRFIPDTCDGKITYELEEVDRQMFKREVGSVKSNFGEFVGNKIIRYNIVNLASAAARKTE